MKKSFVVLLGAVLVGLGCSAEKEIENPVVAAPAADSAVALSADSAAPGTPPVAPPPGMEGSASSAAALPAVAPAAAGASAEEVAANPKKFMAPATPRDYGADGRPNLSSLTDALRDWIALAAEIPSDVKEVNDGRYLRFPQPPAGQKYVINKEARTIELAAQ